VPALPAKPSHLADGHAHQADLRQGILDLVQLKGLYISLDFFHEMALPEKEGGKQKAEITRKSCATLRTYTYLPAMSRAHFFC